MHNKFLLTLLTLLSTTLLFAQDTIPGRYPVTPADSVKKNDKWDVSNPYTSDWNIKKVALNTNEGTWMNLDVSPDGTRIVFDLLGDIYIMPITGGKATALRSGMAYELQPRFSPDGRRIAFTSDAAGGDNIWIMDLDGSNAKQFTKESFRLLNNPVRTSDGSSINTSKILHKA